MTAASQDRLQPMLDKLEHWRPLDESDRAAILALPHRVAIFRPQEYIVREGEEPKHTCVILSGFAVRHKIAGNGGRQIFSFQMRGDLADLQNSLLRTADHNLQALTRAEVALVPIDAIQKIAFERSGVGRAFWRETLVDASVFREWTLNVGRRDGHARTAHLLCELSYRLEAAGLGARHDYELPMTQEQMADALALTPVHVNRMLQRLQREQLIERSARAVRIIDWPKLADAGDFDSTYLHLQEAVPA